MSGHPPAVKWQVENIKRILASGQEPPSELFLQVARVCVKTGATPGELFGSEDYGRFSEEQRAHIEKILSLPRVLEMAEENARMNGRPERIIGAEDDEPGIEHSGVRSTGGVAAAADWVPFPADALPESVARFVREAGRAINIDESVVSVTLLATLASCVGTTRFVSINADWREPCVIWSATVAPSGTKKSPTMRLVLGPLRREQDLAFKDHAEELKRYEGHALIYERTLRDWSRAKGATDPPLPPIRPEARRYILDDTTTEAAAMILKSNPRGVLLASDELSGWISAFDRYRSGRGGDAQRWISCYSAEALTVDRKGSGTIHIPKAAVSVTGTIQPRILAEVLGRRNLENGLAARFVLAMPPERPALYSSLRISESSKTALAGIVAGLLALRHDIDPDGNPCAVVLPFTGEAEAAFRAWHDENAMDAYREGDSDVKAALSKLPGQCARLALLVELIEAVGEGAPAAAVEAGAVRRAISLARWFGHEARRVYARLGESPGDRELRELEDWIRRHGSVATIRDVTRGPRTYRGKHEAAEETMDRLVRQGRAAWEDSGPGAGHPTRRLRLT
jgi:hypothetical protein